MRAIHEFARELWLRVRPDLANLTFSQRLKHIAEETVVTLAILLALALVHYVAAVVHVENVVLFSRVKVGDFLNLAHAANMARLVLFSIGLKVL